MPCGLSRDHVQFRCRPLTETFSANASDQTYDASNKGYRIGETGPDVGGEFHLSGSHNFIGIIDSIAGLDDTTYTQFGTAKAPLDPLLGPLDYYGGPTLGHLPLLGSPLLDTGDNAAAVDFEGNPLATDQRGDGFPRIADEVVDIGALEASSSYLYIVNSTADTVAEDGVITLREAIEAIRTGMEVGDAPAPIQLSGDYPLFIRFDDSLHGEKITLTQGDLDITRSVWIQGPGAELLTIDAGGEDRAFAVLEAGNVWVSGLTIENGYSNSNYGGGAIWAHDTDFRLTDMVVRQCASYAVSVYGGTLSLADSTFLNNAGALLTNTGPSDLDSIYNIMNCLFDGNAGGAVHLQGGTTVIANSRFQENRANYGGAVYASFSGNVEIVNSVFSGNTAKRGGAVSAYANSTITITNSTFSGNAARFGGVVYAYHDTAITIINSTLAGNVASEGAGIYMDGGDLIIENSILFNEGQTEIAYEGTGYSQTNNLIGIDPRFVRNPTDGGDGWGDDPATADVDESANDDYGDLRLRADSPARDEGDNDLLPEDIFDLDGDGDVSEPLPVDLAGNPRIQNGTVDMGAYEFTPAAPGDMNADGLIDSLDLDMVRAHWGRAVAPGDTFAGDANGDGMVNGTDLDIVRGNWTTGAQAAAADAVLAAAAESNSRFEAAEISDVYGPLPAGAVRRVNLFDMDPSAFLMHRPKSGGRPRSADYARISLPFDAPR